MLNRSVMGTKLLRSVVANRAHRRLQPAAQSVSLGGPMVNEVRIARLSRTGALGAPLLSVPRYTTVNNR
jgi:hypothetical protein